MENQVEVPEYKQLVGGPVTGNESGSYVIDSQGGSEDFARVSSLWMPQTKSFDECLQQLETEKSNRVDILSKWEDWKFVVDGKNIALENVDGRKFTPTSYAIRQICSWASTLPSFVEKTLEPEFEADEEDLNQLVGLLNYRKQRHHQDNKGNDRELLFRTYQDNTLRAVLTKGYACIDTVWFFSLLKDLIPGGRVSHLRGGVDTVYSNILIPDSIRFDTDSDYGGLFAVKNSEIGQASLDCCPSVFRAICMNGCLHQNHSGISLRKVHKGEIDLKVLAVQIKENLDEQIKIIPSVMEKFLSIRQYEFAPELTMGVFSAVAERFKIAPKQANDVLQQFIKYESHENTGFSIINSITRASQLYQLDECERFDKIGGSLVEINWEHLIKKAASYSDKEIADSLNLSV